MREAGSEERLRILLRANQELTSALELREVLQRVVETAVDLVPARYAALGVLDLGKQRLSEFIQVGLDETDAARIGHLPRGHGLLGELISRARPVRTGDVGSHPASRGFPAHHPSMESFLGVPIWVRDEVFGNLYLTDHVDGAFSADDEELVEALASTAGIAIANARLFEETRYRARWSSALSEAAREAGALHGDPVELLLSTAHELADSDLACVSQRAGEGPLTVTHARGIRAAEMVGQSHPVEGAVDASDPEQSIVAPFEGTRDVRGVLWLAREDGDRPFLDRDVEMAESFAAHIGATLGQIRAREAQQRTTLVEDRERIARDLHDHVVQRLYATGLRLSAISGEVDAATAERVASQIEEIDATIIQIRQAIHALRVEDDSSPRIRLARLVDDTVGFEAAPELVVDGPLDLLATPDLVADLLAVVREGLSNAVRHGRAHSARVRVTATPDRVEVRIVDDGTGLGPTTHHIGGLSNLRERARSRGGTLELRDAGADGTELVWDVPLRGMGTNRE